MGRVDDFGRLLFSSTGPQVVVLVAHAAVVVVRMAVAVRVVRMRMRVTVAVAVAVAVIVGAHVHRRRQRRGHSIRHDAHSVAHHDPAAGLPNLRNVLQMSSSR